ncbi:MAG: hypothetical protein ACYC6K_06705 [Bellilinea sp.]
MLGHDVVVDILNQWDTSGRITQQLSKVTHKKVYDVNDCVIASGPMLLLQQIGALSRPWSRPPISLSNKLFDPIIADHFEPIPISDVIKGTAKIRLLGIHKNGTIGVWHQFFPTISLFSAQIDVVEGVESFVYNYCSHLWLIATPAEKIKLKYWLLWSIHFNNNSLAYFHNWLKKNNLDAQIINGRDYLTLIERYFPAWVSKTTRKLSMSLYGMWQETLVGQTKTEKLIKDIVDDKTKSESHSTLPESNY